MTLVTAVRDDVLTHVVHERDAVCDSLAEELHALDARIQRGIRHSAIELAAR